MGADIPGAEPMRSAYLTLTVDSAEEAERQQQPVVGCADGLHQPPEINELDNENDGNDADNDAG